MVKYEELRREVIQTGINMLQTHLVAGTWGNISVRIPEEKLMAITPSGVDYEIIKPEDIVIIDFDGNIIDGDKKPSIELGLHLEVYKNRLNVNAIVHTHSEYCTAFAMARKPVPAAAEDLVQIVGGDVRVSRYALPGSKELGEAAIEAMEERNAVILANHGCLGVAKDLKEALKVVTIVEKSAKAAIFANLLGGVVKLNESDIDFMRDFYLNKYGQR